MKEQNFYLEYEQKKEILTKELEKANNSSAQISLKKTSSNLFRSKTKATHEKQIDVREFNRVLKVDKENLLADVEGMTTYEDLVNETLKYNCLPTVVPELKSITIGGALAGCGIESSSFRYGLVHETIQETEILLGDGKLVSCSPHNEHKDLFFAFPNTYGSLGYALKIQVKLIPVKKYVKLVHKHYTSPKDFFEALQNTCSLERKSDHIAFIEGVIFDKEDMYITTGEFVDDVPFVSDYRYMNIYYQSIKEKQTDYLTTLDYIWRWDPDWFWCSKVFMMQNPLLRMLFGKFMLKSRVYSKIMHYFKRHPALSAMVSAFQEKRESVIQDTLIPIESAVSFLSFFQNEIGIKPIWICPTQPYSMSNQFDFCPLDPGKLYVDFGFWDSVPTDKENGFYNKKIEKTVKDLEGFKSLYSTSYYTEEEFWHLFNKKRYQELKQKYDPKRILKDLYAKCSLN